MNQIYWKFFEALDKNFFRNCVQQVFVNNDRNVDTIDLKFNRRSNT